MATTDPSLLRRLPKVDRVLSDPDLRADLDNTPRQILTDAVRWAIDQIRRRMLDGDRADADETRLHRDVLHLARQRVAFVMGPHYRKVINATGIILHTALGRAVLARKALDQIADELDGYCVLQADIEAGKRSKRDGRIEWLLQQITGCEAATVVNNNAAATSIVLNTLAKGREVIVSRGQLVEIGGAFRLPDVMAASGVTLVEVGTTNKTHLRDYAGAITENTGAIMRLHPSNYKIVGFTSEVPLHDLVRLAHEHDLPMIDDVGAGALIDFSRFGFEPEPTLLDSVSTGADVITASADKLIGAHQGGIILGKATIIDAIRKNPMARIVRVGKLTLAPLEATLSLFLDEQLALSDVPILRMLMRPHDEIAQQAERIAAALRQTSTAATVTTDAGFSQMGSGSLPAQNLATTLVVIEPMTISAEELGRRLRQHRPAVFARLQKGCLLVDPRTVLPGEEEPLVQAIVQALNAEA